MSSFSSPMPGALDVAVALGPAVAVGVQPRAHVLQVAAREVEHLVAEAVVAGPAPDQRDRAGELDDLVGVEVVGHVARRRVGGADVLAVPDGAVGDDLVHDHARAVAEQLGDVAHRAHVGLDRPELPERDAGVRGVGAVDGEQPRVVREARRRPSGRAARHPRTSTAALVGPADLELASPSASGRRGSACPSRSTAAAARCRAARAATCAPSALRVRRCFAASWRSGRVEQPAELAARLGERVLRAGDGDPDAPPSAAPGASPCSAAGRPCRGRTGPSSHSRGIGSGFCVGGAAATGAERAVVARPDRRAPRGTRFEPTIAV